MSVSSQGVMVVGLGAAGTSHVRALEEIPDAAVIAGVDSGPSRTLTFRKRQVPVYTALFEATSAKLKPCVVVIATPTPSHAQVCDEVAGYFPKATILVEKPAADKLADALRIMEGVGGKQPVNVAYHMAFSPEVDWALSQVRTRAANLGVPIQIESWHADPYQSELHSAQTRLGTSWIDSGINALSVIERFAKPVKCTSLRQIPGDSGMVYEGTFTCETKAAACPALVLTSWHSTAPTRTTRIKYSNGAELVMDHNAVAGYLLENGALKRSFGSDGTVPRREAHYNALYKSLLIDHDQIFPIETSIRMHKLLLETQAT